MKRTPFAELAQYMDLLLDAICAVDKDSRLTYVSPGAKNVFGYEPEEMKGRLIFDFVHPDDLEKTKESAYAVNRGEQLMQFENRYIHKNGHVIHLLWSARWSEFDQQRIGVARDISVQKQLEEDRENLIKKLSEMALTDPLTQLPNRSLFYDRVEAAKARAHRDQKTFAILYIDLDKFKHINDERGHATGDQLLREVGRRISGAIRATDTAARIGGDEFTVLVDAVPSNDNSAVTAVADKILAALQPPLILPHGQEKVTASIGIALWPQHGSNIESLLNFADEAMYSAKRAGGNQYWL
ncbi:sensor domain-containing protein [Aliidiomarina celeris]|uniref:sensor domain-containing protein n=1 Tax=Aliidiomarina celeris TaxID=2249428 RepID=UPI000DEBFF11|nr:sensor domain-containing diguanylate cyclase [Aliidiomarina celeris]